MSDYPEHDKMISLRPEIDAVTRFLEWFDWRAVPEPSARNATYRLAVIDEDGDVYGTPRIEDLLAEHFEIDTDKIEAEKRAMLAELHRGIEGAAREDAAKVWDEAIREYFNREGWTLKAQEGLMTEMPRTVKP